MITKTSRKMTRWLAAAGCVGAAAASYASDSAATTYNLFAVLTLSNANCNTDASGNTLYARAEGFAPSGEIPDNCLVATQGSTADTQCDATSSWSTNQASVLSLDSNFGEHTLLLCTQTSSWTDTSQCTYNIPAHGSCPAGNTAQATSFGRAN